MKKVIIGAVALVIAGMSCKSNGEETNDPKIEGDEPKVEVVETNTEVADAEHAGAIHITKADFIEQIMDYEANPNQWVFKGDKPGLVDFYADWCRPCKITSPILDELAIEYAGKINIYKVDVQVERELAGLFGVQSIPTFLYMPLEGQPTLTSGIAQTPEQTKEMFRQQIEQILLNNSASEEGL